MRLADGRVVPNFIAQALRGEPLTIYGNGSQTRSFQYVDDLVDGVFRLLMSNFNDPVNIGNPHEMSIVEFAQVVNEVIGNPAGIVYKHEERIQGDPQTRQPDISRARDVLDWEPKVNLQEGLERTVTYFQAVL
jgi:dTDP-glucose 4,6-dehydratase